MTRHATYCGPLQHLVGKGALIRSGFHSCDMLVQFDDRKARRSGLPWPQVWCDEPHTQHAGWWEDSDTPPIDALGYGWHEFPAEHFEDDPQ